jgi:Flp pilus assembly protein TadG
MNRRRKRRARAWWASDDGGSAVEFALVLPLLVILLFAFFQIGWLIWSYSIVNSSVRDASRYAARQDVNCSATPPSFIDGTATAKIQRLARTGQVEAGGSPVLPQWTNDASVTVTVTCLANPVSGTTYKGVYDTLAKIPTIDVHAEAPFTTILTPFVPALALTSIRVNHSEAWTQQ